MSEILTDAEKAAILRKALVALVGSDDVKELEDMEVAIRMLPAPDQDIINAINAIHALIKTA